MPITFTGTPMKESELHNKTKMAKPESGVFVNPFSEGVSYSDFIKALSGSTVKAYLTDKDKSQGVSFTSEDIEWLTAECENYTLNLKK